MPFQIKRIYEAANKDDGLRILIDRLWPRGISKERARLDGWLKEVAPSPDLRKWFGHDPDKFDLFRQRYLEELRSDEQKKARLSELYALGKKGLVSLLYGAKSPSVNHAVVLMEFLDSHMKRVK